jgi:serine/threonine-protein kinase RsbW
LLNTNMLLDLAARDLPPVDPTKATSQNGCEVRVSIPATFDAIERLFDSFRRNCKCVLEHSDCFAAELLLREALTNAVVHGSRGDPAKNVRCALRMKRGRLLIAVQDEGEGFDWRAAQTREADISDCCGRGMQIFRAYATRARFNDKGNAVAIVKDFGQVSPKNIASEVPRIEEKLRR